MTLAFPGYLCIYVLHTLPFYISYRLIKVAAYIPPQSNTIYLVPGGNFNPLCFDSIMRQYNDADSGSRAISIRSLSIPAYKFKISCHVRTCTL